MNNQSLLDQWRNKSIDQFIPLQASLELTNRCNERCGHCYIPSFKDDPAKVLKIESWYQILNELRSAGTLYIILMGGEAMLNPHFWDIAKKSNELGFHTTMISNGLKINKIEVAEKLKSVGIKMVTISLYSLDPKIHDTMTSVKGSFQKTMNAISYLRKAGVKVTINSLLTTLNVKTIFDLEDWCYKNDLELKIDPTVTSKLNGDMAPTRLRASKEQLKWFYEQRKNRWEMFKLEPAEELNTDYVCNAAKGKCAVTAYGDLLPCIEIRDPLGNLVENKFSDIWYKPEAKKWRDIKFSDLSKKSASGFCEHCPGMAKNELGDHLQELDFSVMLSQVKKEVSETQETNV